MMPNNTSRDEDLVWPLGALTEAGFTAYGYGRGIPGYPSIGYSFPGFPGFSYIPSPAAAEHPTAFFVDAFSATAVSTAAALASQMTNVAPQSDTPNSLAPLGSSPIKRGNPFAPQIATVEMNGQQTSPPLITQALSVINGYGPQGFATPTSPVTGRGFPTTNSPGPMDIYASNHDGVGYVHAASPQPSGFPSVAVSRGPLIAAAFTNGYH